MAELAPAGYTLGSISLSSRPVMLLRLPSALLLSGLLSGFVVAGCQCNLNNDDLTQLEDSGFPPNDAGPPPPTFPLKPGDHLQMQAFGGRTATCEGSATTGDCDRALRAEYIIQSVALNAANRWEVTADVVYQGSTDTIPAAAIVPLILDNGAPFSAVTAATPSSATGAVFQTATPATDQLTPNGFPFFQYDTVDATVFEEAGEAFCERYLTLDAGANCRVQLADQKMEVFYRDEAAGAAKLHKVRAEYHQFGFVCGWDELLIPFVDGMQRAQSDVPQGETPELAAIFAGSPRLVRDGVSYTCSCFSQQCRAGNGAEARCLSTDPDAPPGPCP
jgi:hypothetical protein